MIIQGKKVIIKDEIQLINETTPVPMEFHGRYYNSAEEWKEHDPVAFRESYMAWIDGNERDGIDTGDDGYEANNRFICCPKAFNGTRDTY